MWPLTDLHTSGKITNGSLFEADYEERVLLKRRGERRNLLTVRVAALALAVIAVMLYTARKLGGPIILNNGRDARPTYTFISSEHLVKQIYKRSNGATIKSQYFCIPEHNYVYNPTFENYADGWSRSFFNISQTALKMTKWDDDSGAGILISNTDETASEIQSQLQEEVPVDLVAGTNYTVRFSYTPVMLTSTVDNGVFITGSLTSADHSALNSESFSFDITNNTISTVSFTIVPIETGKVTVTLSLVSSSTILYIHSITVFPTSDTSCGSDIGYDVAKTTSTLIPTMSDSFCVPATNIIRDPRFTDLSSWVQSLEADEFQMNTWSDGTAMGAVLRHAYNYTNTHMSSLTQILPKNTYSTGSYFIEVTYSIYQVSDAPVYSSVEKESNLNLTITVESSQDTITALDWKNSTLYSATTNTTNTLYQSVNLNADYDVTISILAKSTMADIFIHTVIIYEIYDNSCDAYVTPEYTIEFMYSTPNMSSLLCTPSTNTITDPLFENLHDWTIEVAYDGSLEQTRFADGSAAGVIVNALTEEQFKSGITTAIVTTVETELSNHNFTLQISDMLLPRSGAPSVPEITYFCHIKANSTETIWQGHVHSSMVYGENYVDQVSFLVEQSGDINVRCYFAAEEADFYIFSFEVIADDYVPPIPDPIYCQQANYTIFKVSGHTEDFVLY
ncbi:hypothetical protein V1511DRAFT_503965 [Dipodascopsis uninucleata]